MTSFGQKAPWKRFKNGNSNILQVLLSVRDIMPKRVGTFLDILDKTLRKRKVEKKKLDWNNVFARFSAAFAHPGQSPWSYGNRTGPEGTGVGSRAASERQPRSQGLFATSRSREKTLGTRLVKSCFRWLWPRQSVHVRPIRRPIHIYERFTLASSSSSHNRNKYNGIRFMP